MSSREEDFGCEQRADAAPYVLGALEEAESYRRHLAGCATCRAEVAELQLVVDTLPATVPPVVASKALRERVLATVRSEANCSAPPAARPTGHQVALDAGDHIACPSWVPDSPSRQPWRWPSR
jgi:hypothetical protein